MKKESRHNSANFNDLGVLNANSIVKHRLEEGKYNFRNKVTKHWLGEKAAANMDDLVKGGP